MSRCNWKPNITKAAGFLYLEDMGTSSRGAAKLLACPHFVPLHQKYTAVDDITGLCVGSTRRIATAPSRSPLDHGWPVFELDCVALAPVNVNFGVDFIFLSLALVINCTWTKESRITGACDFVVGFLGLEQTKGAWSSRAVLGNHSSSFFAKKSIMLLVDNHYLIGESLQATGHFWDNKTNVVLRNGVRRGRQIQFNSR